MSDDPAIAGAEACLDAFMTAFNARDREALAKTFHYPSIRLHSNRVTILDGPSFFVPDHWERRVGRDWHHSAWDRRDVIHAGADKVHFDTRFTRYRADNSVIGHYDSIYIVTCEDGRWGIRCRSSFAP